MRTIFARLILASLTAATALSVASCQQAPATWAGAPQPPAPAGPLWNEPQFTTMLHAYRRKLPGKLRALRFEMYDNAASLEVQDPAQQRNVDSYNYKGGELRGPSHVDISGVLADPNLEDNLFDWDRVAVDRIPALVKAALAHTELAGAIVVSVKITRRAASSAEMGRRIEMLIDAKRRAMERKLRLEQNPLAGGEPDGGKTAQPPGSVVAPLEVEISVQLEAPGGFGWLTADASGKITGSSVKRDEDGLPADIKKRAVPRPRPYWRSR